MCKRSLGHRRQRCRDDGRTEFEGENVMTRPFRPALIITFLALLTGCISGPPLQTTVITSPSKRLEIYWVRTYQDKKGVLVTGTVRRRSEEHTSELQSLMRNSYAVFCLQKTKKIRHKHTYI